MNIQNVCEKPMHYLLYGCKEYNKEKIKLRNKIMKIGDKWLIKKSTCQKITY